MHKVGVEDMFILMPLQVQDGMNEKKRANLLVLKTHSPDWIRVAPELSDKEIGIMIKPEKF